MIDTHQNCIEILEAIEHYKTSIKHTEDSIENFKKLGFNPHKYKHNLIIYNMCIERLKLRYKFQIHVIKANNGF